MEEPPDVTFSMRFKRFDIERPTTWEAAILYFRVEIPIWVSDEGMTKPTLAVVRVDTATDVSLLPAEVIQRAALLRHRLGTVVLSTITGSYRTGVFAGTYCLDKLPDVKCKTHFGAMPKESMRKYLRRLFNWRSRNGNARQGLLSLRALTEYFDVDIRQVSHQQLVLGLKRKPTSQ